MDIVMPYLLEIAATLLITLIGVLGAWLTSKIGKREELKTINEATFAVISAAQETVGELKQTVVDYWKKEAKDGKLTGDQIEELQFMLINQTKSKLATPVIGLLEGAKVDINRLIISAAENLISQMK